MSETNEKPTKISEFKTQDMNANKHTERGVGLLEKSMSEEGWIGAITVAADNGTFDGSARLEKGIELFGEDAEPIIVESDGTRPVIVRRTDIPSAEDPRAKRLSVLANRIQEIDLNWDFETLENYEIDLTKLGFSELELAKIEEEYAGAGEEEEISDINAAFGTQITPTKEYVLFVCEEESDFQEMVKMFSLRTVKIKNGSFVQKVVDVKELLSKLKGKENEDSNSK